MTDKYGRGHHVEVERSIFENRWVWHCDECAWAGYGCPSEAFALQEHASVAARIASGEIRAETRR